MHASTLPLVVAAAVEVGGDLEAETELVTLEGGSRLVAV